MHEITPEKCRVWAQCRDCMDWTFIQGKPEDYGNLIRGVACSKCHSSRMDPQSVISERTFDPARAKKRKAKSGVL